MELGLEAGAAAVTVGLEVGAGAGAGAGAGGGLRPVGLGLAVGRGGGAGAGSSVEASAASAARASSDRPVGPFLGGAGGADVGVGSEESESTTLGPGNLAGNDDPRGPGRRLEDGDAIATRLEDTLHVVLDARRHHVLGGDGAAVRIAVLPLQGQLGEGLAGASVADDQLGDPPGIIHQRPFQPERLVRLGLGGRGVQQHRLLLGANRRRGEEHDGEQRRWCGESSRAQGWSFASPC